MGVRRAYRRPLPRDAKRGQWVSEVPNGETALASAVAAARATGIERVHLVAWRDLDDEEAGGSELHAHRIASLWAEHGMAVTLRTSRVKGLPARDIRDGYQVLRRGGRYMVFPRTAFGASLFRMRPGDALVEIWNGMPFFSPIWARRPRVVFLHHVHAEMWRMVLPRPLAALGCRIEARIAPPFYRRTRIVTLSESSRQEIVDMLGMDPAMVTVVPPGVERRFRQGGVRSEAPLVAAVGRLVPVKRFELLIQAAAELKPRYPDLRLVIAGEGYERPKLEVLIRRLRAESWVELPGRLDDFELVELYQSAWLLASSSLREGWGMTVTEAAACGTPAVVTDIAGHRDAVIHGRTGLLVEQPGELAGAMDVVLGDAALRSRLGAAAAEHAATLTWEATAARSLTVLAGEAALRHGSSVRQLGHQVPVAGA